MLADYDRLGRRANPMLLPAKPLANTILGDRTPETGDIDLCPERMTTAARKWPEFNTAFLMAYRGRLVVCAACKQNTGVRCPLCYKRAAPWDDSRVENRPYA
jgi:hypothetical protein